MKGRFSTTEYVRGLTIAGMSRAQVAADGRVGAGASASASQADLTAAEQRLKRQIDNAAFSLRMEVRALRRTALILAAVGLLLILLGFRS